MRETQPVLQVAARHGHILAAIFIMQSNGRQHARKVMLSHAAAGVLIKRHIPCTSMISGSALCETGQMLPLRSELVLRGACGTTQMLHRDGVARRAQEGDVRLTARKGKIFHANAFVILQCARDVRTVVAVECGGELIRDVCEACEVRVRHARVVVHAERHAMRPWSMRHISRRPCAPVWLR